jgi:FkbM family methyltransferase
MGATLHRLLWGLAGSPRLVGLARRVAGLCRLLVGYHFTRLASHTDLMRNGEAWLARRVGPDALTIMDVGANVGEWAAVLLEAAPPQADLLLVDAGAEAAARLAARFGAERVLRAAVSDAHAPASMRFYEAPGAGETSSLLASGGGADAIAVDVPVTTVAAEVARLGWARLDLLKIDTEGYDLHVLRGAEPLLRERRIGVVQFEYNAPWREVGSTLGEAIARLEGCGYAVFMLSPRGLHRFDYARWGEFYSYANFVALAPEWVPKLEDAVREAL